MSGFRDVILAKKKREQRFEANRNVQSCITAGVEYEDSPAVSGRPGYIWVREYGSDAAYFQVFNAAVQERVGVPVLVAMEPKKPYRRAVIDVDWNIVIADLVGSSTVGSPYLPNHSGTHEWPDAGPGADPVTIYTRAIYPFRGRPSSSDDMYIRVSPGFYTYSGETKAFNGAEIDLENYVPPAGYVTRVLVYFDPAANGLNVSLTAPVESDQVPPYPLVDAKYIPICYVYLTETTTEIEDDIISDARALFHSASTYTRDDALKQLATLETELDQLITRNAMDINILKRAMVALETSFDYIITRHIVG